MGKHLNELWEALPPPLRLLGWVLVISGCWMLMRGAGLVGT
jgi:hypothetical protein